MAKTKKAEISSVVITFKVTEDERRQIQSAAKGDGRSTSSFIRRAILKGRRNAK